MITKAISGSLKAVLMTDEMDNQSDQRDDATTRAIWQAGPWRIEPLRHRIINAGETRRLQPRLMDLLMFLIENRHRYVSRDEILDNVWTTPHVTPHALSNAISKLRQLLGDDASDQTYILTKRGVGYQFVAEVAIAEDTDPLATTSLRVRCLNALQQRPIAIASAAAGMAVIVTLIFLTTSENSPIGFAYSNDIAPVLDTLDVEGWEIETEEDSGD